MENKLTGWNTAGKITIGGSWDVYFLKSYMYIINITGGLGNQLFQYAFALALCEYNKSYRVLIDPSCFRHGYNTHKYELSTAFKIELKEISFLKKLWFSLFSVVLPKKFHTVIEPTPFVYYQSLFQEKGVCRMIGYWQSYKYFSKYWDTIRKSLKFVNTLPVEANCYLIALKNDQSIAIHVRRGNYLDESNKHLYAGICDIEYYYEAIRRVKDIFTHPQFIIFSNDIMWCKNNLVSFVGECPCLFVDNLSSYGSDVEMQLMSFARCNVIANSTFSWWSAYLNQRENHIVISPKIWINNYETSDIFPKDWILI